MMVIICSFPQVSMGQTDTNKDKEETSRAIDTIFSSFEGTPGFTSVTYGPEMLKMISGRSSDESVKELIGNLQLIRIIVTTGDNSGILSFLTRLSTIGDSYKLISSVTENEKKTQFFYKKEQTGLSSFLMISKENDKTTVLDIYGDFNVKDISKLSIISGAKRAPGK